MSLFKQRYRENQLGQNVRQRVVIKFLIVGIGFNFFFFAIGDKDSGSY